MMAAVVSFVAALAGFGLISLTMQRHTHMLSNAGLKSSRAKAMLRWFGAIALAGSGAVALHDNPQLGAVYWSGYLMVAALLVTGLHAYADR